MVKKINCLITGGAGFIGSHLAEKLSRNKRFKVTILDNLSTGRLNNINHLKNIKFLKVDISKEGKWEKLLKS